MYEAADDIRGRWLDFRVDLRFSRSPCGLIRMWIGPKQIVDYRGVNAYPSGAGYADRFYFKVGLYRDAMARPMSMFLDDFRKERLGRNAF